MRPKAYTIVELIVVITIILILAAAAIGGTGGIIRSLRFSNTFNKMVLMVQQARSNAITGKGDVDSYRIDIDTTNKKLEMFSVKGGVDTSKEKLELQDSTGMIFSVLAGTTQCPTAKIEFTSPKTEAETKTTLTCGTLTDSDVKQLEIFLCSETPCTDTNGKSFLINKAAGIPQVQ